jgi:hypothetical protein
LVLPPASIILSLNLASLSRALPWVKIPRFSRPGMALALLELVLL